jgi:hypothetical protein
MVTSWQVSGTLPSNALALSALVLTTSVIPPFPEEKINAELERQ